MNCKAIQGKVWCVLSQINCFYHLFFQCAILFPSKLKYGVFDLPLRMCKANFSGNSFSFRTKFYHFHAPDCRPIIGPGLSIVDQRPESFLRPADAAYNHLLPLQASECLIRTLKYHFWVLEKTRRVLPEAGILRATENPLDLTRA